MSDRPSTDQGRPAKRRPRSRPDLYKDMTLPKACGILGLRDREFRDGDFEMIHSAFSRQVVVDVNPDESGTRSKQMIKNQMQLHEAYQFLLKRKTSQLEHEALEAEMKRRKHLEDEEAISNSAQDDTEAILKAAKSERSQKFDSSGTIQFNPHQVESHQNAIVNYLDQKAEASHEKNLVDRSLDRAGYARVVKVIGSAKSNDYRGVTQVSNFKEIPKLRRKKSLDDDLARLHLQS